MRRDKTYLLSVQGWGVRVFRIRGAQGIVVQDKSVKERIKCCNARISLSSLSERGKESCVWVTLPVCELWFFFMPDNQEYNLTLTRTHPRWLQRLLELKY